jgi:hypothetical protein
MTMTHARNLAALAATLVLSGCGGQTAADRGQDPPATEDTIEHPTSAIDPVLTIDTSGGFVPASYFLGDIPEVTITGDGTVYLSGQRSTGLVRPVRTADLGEAGLQQVLGWADDAGLLDGSGDHPLDKDKVITDAPTTRVTFVLGDGGTVVEHSAYALGLDETDDDSRQALARFVDDVEQLVADLPTEDYDPTSLVVHAILVKPGGGHVFHPDGVAELELTEGCQLVEDPAAVEALTSGQVPAHDEAGEWTIAARPVLPGDRGCEDPKSTLE